MSNAIDFNYSIITVGFDVSSWHPGVDHLLQADPKTQNRQSIYVVRLHACIHACIHACKHELHTCMHNCLPACTIACLSHACIHDCMPENTNSCLHTSLHELILTSIYQLTKSWPDRNILSSSKERLGRWKTDKTERNDDTWGTRALENNPNIHLFSSPSSSLR